MIEAIRKILKSYTCGQCGRTFSNAVAFLTHICSKPEKDDK